MCVCGWGVGVGVGEGLRGVQMVAFVPASDCLVLLFYINVLL